MFFVDTLLKLLKVRLDEDNFDRLNYYVTPMVMCLFALVVGGQQLFGQPIECWTPADFNFAWHQYAELYCFVSNNYYVPITENIPSDVQEREAREIGYYQWVPFVLALQSFLFLCPILIWRFLSQHSGFRAKTITRMAADVSNMQSESRKENVKVIVDHFQTSLAITRNLKKSFGRRYRIYLCILYLLVKMLFVVNIVGQFCILNNFLGPQYSLWGIEVVKSLALGQTWKESGLFPRMTLCDMQIRKLGQIQHYVMQCVLMINMLNEKIFVFLWWWFLILAILGVINLLYWFAAIIKPSNHYNFVQSYLPGVSKRMLKRFVCRELRPDGVLLIRFIATNGSELVATELIKELWMAFFTSTTRKRKNSDASDVDIETGEQIA